MQKDIFKQNELTLLSSSTFVETPTIVLPGTTSGIIIARISGISESGSEDSYAIMYCSEAIASWRKNDGGTLTIGTFKEINKTEYGFTIPTISFVVNSNNLRVRITRNGYPLITYWMIDMDIFIA